MAGDDHSLKRWVSPDFERTRLSIVGLGRSADASAYYLPELGLVLDAGCAVKSLAPKCVLLTHGHRDHTAALPALARNSYAPRAKAWFSLSQRERRARTRKKRLSRESSRRSLMREKKMTRASGVAATQAPVRVYAPAAIEPLVRDFLFAEGQLNFGVKQTRAEQIEAIGDFDVLFRSPESRTRPPPLSVLLLAQFANNRKRE